MSSLTKALIPIVGLMGLGGAAYLLTKHGGSGLGGHNTLDLARSTPQKAFFWMAAEMREEASAEKLVAQMEKARTEYKGFSEFCTSFEKEIGKKPEEIARIYAASGYLAIYTQADKDFIEPNPSQMPVDLVLECQLYDPKSADGLLSQIKQKSKTETLAGQTVYISEKEFCLTIAGDALLIANTRGMMEKAINAAVSHKNTLAEDEAFKKAISKVPSLAHGNGTATYLNLSPLWGTLEKVPQVARYSDADTFKGWRSLPYIVGGMNIQNGHPRGEAFLAVDAQTQTELAKAFLKKPTPAQDLAGAVPESWGCFQSFDSLYVYELLQAMLRLAPMGRMGVTMGLSRAGLGPNGEREKKIRKAFNGQAAWSVDLAAASKASSDDMARLASHGRTTACKSNLKNIATALEMYSTDYGGHYPSSLAPLVTEKYLKTIPTCPAAGKDSYSQTYQAGVAPDSYSFRCSDQDAHDLAYTSEEGLKGRDADGQPEAQPAPQVLGCLLLGVSDPASARELLNEVGGGEKLDLSGREAFHLNLGNLELYWMLLEKPSALALGFGPKGKESLQAVADAATGKTPALAKRPSFSDFAARFSPDSAELSFVNLKALLAQVRESAARSNPGDKATVEQMLGLLESQLSDDLGSIQVEADGLRYHNEGSAGLLGAGAALMLPVMVPNFMKARGQGQLTACKSNEKNLATALEMYASDNAGRYPTDLKPLVSGRYLMRIPTCPAAGTDSYTETYRVTATPDSFSFYCRGNHHAPLVPENYPAYNAETGLIDKP